MLETSCRNHDPRYHKPLGLLQSVHHGQHCADCQSRKTLLYLQLQDIHLGPHHSRPEWQCRSFRLLYLALEVWILLWNAWWWNQVLGAQLHLFQQHLWLLCPVWRVLPQKVKVLQRHQQDLLWKACFLLRRWGQANRQELWHEDLQQVWRLRSENLLQHQGDCQQSQFHLGQWKWVQDYKVHYQHHWEVAVAWHNKCT